MINLSSYSDLHRWKDGKVSDKWDNYLDVYDNVLQSYRLKAVKLLEIGVQNGGSLETWAKFFPAAQNIMGCDINPDCGNLAFQDDRIKVFVGDATETATAQAIITSVDGIDILIEDGSHTSRDIVRSFATYFPELTPGGIYIAEDLHTCYWPEFGGGLGHPSSGMEFFKALADCINSDNWARNDISQAHYINEITKIHETRIEDECLRSIDSLTFYDSMCVIRKASKGKSARIEARVIGGLEEPVSQGHGQLRDIQSKPIHAKPSQDQSDWKSLCKLNAQLASCRQELESIRNSTSWRLTKPLRLPPNTIKKILKKFLRLYYS